MRVAAPVVAVLNLKGGVGKTTVTASIGRGLFDAKVRGVLMVDLDPQFNLTQALQSEADYEEYLKSGKTVLTAFEPPPSTDLFRIKTTSEPPPPASDLERVLWYRIGQSQKRLGIVMGNFDLVKYSLLSNDVLLTAAKTRFLTFIQRSREDYDVLLLDCNPSSSFLTQCALEAATDILVPVRPDKFSVLGLDLLDRFIKRLGMAKPPKLHVLLNGVDRSTLTDTEQLLRGSRFGTLTLRAEMYKSDLLIARPNFHLFPVDRKVGYRNVLRNNIAAICAEFASRIGV